MIHCSSNCQRFLWTSRCETQQPTLVNHVESQWNGCVCVKWCDRCRSTMFHTGRRTAVWLLCIPTAISWVRNVLMMVSDWRWFLAGVWNGSVFICLLHYNNATTTVLRPFVWDYPGEPVPEETLTHPPSWSSSSLYQLLPSITIHSILPVQITCLTIFLHNLSPCPLWSTSWSGALRLIFHAFLHPISIFFSQHMPIPSQPACGMTDTVSNESWKQIINCKFFLKSGLSEILFRHPEKVPCGDVLLMPVWVVVSTGNRSDKHKLCELFVIRCISFWNAELMELLGWTGHFGD